MSLIVSVSGVRGVVGSELTPEVALRFAAEFGTGVGGRVAVGRDGRPSGRSLLHAVVAGLTGVGCDAIDLGIVPTPTCGLLVRELACAGGVQITASHNPSPYNGLKLFGPDGAVVAAAGGRETSAAWARWDGAGSVTDGRTEASRHNRRVLELIDAAAIRARRVEVVLDANGGAGGPPAMELLEQLGCRVRPIGCDPDGRFAHEPEPTPANLREVEAVVRQHPGTIGACLDPDADRLVLIDETGRCLSEELTLALAVRQRLVRDPGPVVINLSTSRVTEDVARSAGVACHRVAVGEANVVAGMRAFGAAVGGEGNGGVIDPRVGWVRDPFIGLGLVLELMATTGQTLAQLAADLPSYTIQKDKHPLAREQLEPGLAALARRWPEATADRRDGLWLAWPGRWLHVRASNTEPIVRIIAEARSGAEAAALCREAAAVLSSE
jgi:phosphomannomutase